MKVRIIDVPPGEAPEEVRRAWVGLILPVALGEVGPRSTPMYGVLSGPRSYLGHLWRVLTRHSPRAMQYVVPVDCALEILEETSPEAAAWWEEHTPHLVGCGKSFGFAVDVCEEIADLTDAIYRGGS
jgi:hypothetical protein